MALVVPNVGEAKIFNNFLNVTAPQTLKLKLYTNAQTPGEADTDADYTEASGFGYSSISLTPGTWVVTPGNPTTAAFPQQTFTFTGNLGNVVGYYVAQTTSGVLMWAEEFTDGPYNIVNNGDQIKITLNITLE